MADAGFLFERDAQRGRVVISLTSKATLDLWRASVLALVANHVWAEPVVYDMSAVESTPLLLNLPNLAPIVREITQAHGPRGPVAVVVREGEAALWQQRLSGLFDGVVNVAAFGSVAAAHAWLDRAASRTPGQ
jgi:hypothetical protein